MADWIAVQENSDDELSKVTSDSSSEDSDGNDDVEEAEMVQLSSDSEDPNEPEELNKPSDDEETDTLSLEEKVKHLQENFKSIPPLMIKKVLQREDVNEDLHATISCLKAMSSMEGAFKTGPQWNRSGSSGGANKKNQRATNFYKKRQDKKNDVETLEENVEKEGKTNEKERNINEKGLKYVAERDDERDDDLVVDDMEIDETENLSLEEKVQILQHSFKGFPPFVIRKVLGRQDVKGDLRAARDCLENMSSMKGTFKKDGDGSKEGATKGRRNRGGREAWEPKQENARGNSRQDTSEKTDEETRTQHGDDGDVGASGGTSNKGGENTPKKKKK